MSDSSETASHLRRRARRALDVIPNTDMELYEVAHFLRKSVKHLREVAADQQRRPKDREFSLSVHRGYPKFRKVGGRWQVYGPTLRKFMEERG